MRARSGKGVLVARGAKAPRRQRSSGSHYRWTKTSIARRSSDEIASEPGTYFLTSGYIGDGNSMVNAEYERALARYGKERAERLLRTMMSHYKRLVYIRMPNTETLEPDRKYAQSMAARFGLRYEEVDGTPEWLRRMMAQQWDGDFVVVQPGERIELKHFYSS